MDNITKYRGCTIKVDFDNCDEGPFEWDNEPVFVSWNSRYHGDYNNWTYYKDMPRTRENRRQTWSSDPDTLMEELKDNPDFIAYAVRAYIHSGITVSLGPRINPLQNVKENLENTGTGYPYNCPFDSGWFGVLIWNVKRAQECLDYYQKLETDYLFVGYKGEATEEQKANAKRYLEVYSAHEKPHNLEYFMDKIAEGFVETWDAYLTGQVFCYETTDPNGDLIGSCGGHYGSTHDLIEECKQEIDAHWRNEHPLLSPKEADKLEFKEKEEE